MVVKETCPRCKGDRWVRLEVPVGKPAVRKCPECGGQGYKIRMMR